MTIQHLRSSTVNKRPLPGSMSDGQIAVNTNTSSPGLFFKDSAGALIKVGPVHVGTTAPNASPAGGGETGNTVGEQWLDTSGGTHVFKVWDGSAWRSESGTFVDVNGDVMTGALGIIAGSAGSPGLYFSGDTNTGLYSPGSDQLALATGGAERARIDSSGRVLVGTSNQRGLLTLGSGSNYSSIDPGTTIKKVDYTSAMGSEAFFTWRTWRSGKSYASGVSGTVTIAIPAPSLLRVKIMATADGVTARNYAYEAYVFSDGGTSTISIIKETTLLSGGSSPAISGANLVFTCPAATVYQSLIYVEVEQVSSQNDTTITFS